MQTFIDFHADFVDIIFILVFKGIYFKIDYFTLVYSNFTIIHTMIICSIIK